MLRKYSFGFVCDPLDHFDREAETSLFLMREINKRGDKLYVCEPKDLFLKQGEPHAMVQQIMITDAASSFYTIIRKFPLPLAKLDCLFLRKDPPFDLAYFSHLLLLKNLEKKMLIVNSPLSLLQYNEKLSALDFPYSPKTLVASRIDLILEWARNFKRGIVVKPLNEAGGRGIHWIKNRLSRSRQIATLKILKNLTQSEKLPIQCQEFLPASKKGDKRIMLMDGKILGAFRRIPKKGEFRANLHLGGRFEKCTLNARDREVTAKIAAWSKEEKLYFVGFDMIGSFLTEINITSPMGIREINVLYEREIEKTILDDLLRKL